MADQNTHINLAELNQTLSHNVIHYDPNRIDYTINDTELTQLDEIGKSIWKDVFFATLGIAIPTILNGIVSQGKLTKEQPWTNEIFINYLVGGICASLAVISLIIWQRESKKKTDIITNIKNKPPFILPQGQ